MIGRSETRVKIVGGTFTIFKPADVSAENSAVSSLEVGGLQLLLDVRNVGVDLMVARMEVTNGAELFKLLFQTSASDVAFLGELI